MAAEITAITERKPVTAMTDRELLEEITLGLRDLEQFRPLLDGFSRGGLLGYRRARAGQT